MIESAGMGDKSIMMGTRVSPDVARVINQMATREDRTPAYMIRKLLEESPRVKAELRNGKKKNG